MAQTPLDTGNVNGDLMNRLANIAPDAPLAAVRAERADVTRYTQSSYRVLLEPDDPGGVSREEREMVALCVAALEGSTPLIMYHRERLRALGVNAATIAAVEQFPGDTTLLPRLTAILRHIDLLTKGPGDATPAHLAALHDVGLTPRDIVTISQLIALMSYEVRVLTGLRLLAEAK